MEQESRSDAAELRHQLRLAKVSQSQYWRPSARKRVRAHHPVPSPTMSCPLPSRPRSATCTCFRPGAYPSRFRAPLRVRVPFRRQLAHACAVQASQARKSDAATSSVWYHLHTQSICHRPLAQQPPAQGERSRLTDLAWPPHLQPSSYHPRAALEWQSL